MIHVAVTLRPIDPKDNDIRDIADRFHAELIADGLSVSRAMTTPLGTAYFPTVDIDPAVVGEAIRNLHIRLNALPKHITGRAHFEIGKG